VKNFIRFLPVLLAIWLSSLACNLIVPPTPSPFPTDIPYPPTPQIATGTDVPVVVLQANQDTLVSLFEQINPGVVAIRVLTEAGDGLGSGFVFDREGHIVTNYHVVEGQTNLEVDFPSGFKAHGVVVGLDPDSDLAVIKVQAPPDELFPLPLGDSSLVKVGQTVVAIGNPFGLSSSMTVGIVSAVGRTLQSIRTAPGGNSYTAPEIIQTDAAINPGNSGGPLLNLSGEVIGVNRAIRTTNYTTDGEPTNMGIGFAISSNIVQRVVPVLIRDGKYDYPYLGISSLSEITLIQQEALGLDRSVGAYVTLVIPGGPADRAGLRAGTSETSIEGLLAGGDLIIAVDGRPVQHFNDLIGYLFLNKSPDDSVVLTVYRDGKEVELTLTLGKRP
jgi:2-alkenal reductase